MKSPSDPIKLIVGLGNPGSEYENTRHNAGQDFVVALANKYSQTLSPSQKFFGLEARINIQHKDIRLLVPTTFMNRSGQSVASIAQFYKIAPENMLVAHDELDLSPGIAKLKKGGGHGGHNGLRDIITCLGNQNSFARLRLGIGHPGSAKQVANFVLKKPQIEEKISIDNAIEASLNAVQDLTIGNWDKAMRELHSKT